MVCILLCVIYGQIGFWTVAQKSQNNQNRYYCVNIFFYSSLVVSIHVSCTPDDDPSKGSKHIAIPPKMNKNKC